MADSLYSLSDGFQHELMELLGRNPEFEEDVYRLSPEEAAELGRQGARAALAPLIWRRHVGDRYDVMDVADRLKMSRQAVYKRIRSGTLLGIQGEGTTWLPSWQFRQDREGGWTVRPVAARILATFRGADEDLSPLTIAAWVTHPNDDLDHLSPADAITKGEADDDTIERLARRAARALGA